VGALGTVYSLSNDGEPSPERSVPMIGNMEPGDRALSLLAWYRLRAPVPVDPGRVQARNELVAVPDRDGRVPFALATWLRFVTYRVATVLLGMRRRTAMLQNLLVVRSLGSPPPTPSGAVPGTTRLGWREGSGPGVASQAGRMDRTSDWRHSSGPGSGMGAAVAAAPCHRQSLPVAERPGR